MLTSNHRRQQNNKRRCKICSFKQVYPEISRPVFHNHFSSKQSRTTATLNGEDAFYCITCNGGEKPGKIHPFPNDQRIKILVSSSTLHNFFNYGKYEGDQFHIEYVTIPGGHIQDLELAWKVDYQFERRPMDVILVAGLNNVARGESETEIMKHIESFANAVEDQTQQFHLNKASTFTVATFIFPPKLTWFSGNGPLPYKNKMNKLTTIASINHQIVGFNKHLLERQKLTYADDEYIKRKQPKTPMLNMFGLQTITTSPTGEQIQRISHKWSKWRPTEPPKHMLHLNDYERAKMGRMIGNFFMKEYPM